MKRAFVFLAPVVLAALGMQIPLGCSAESSRAPSPDAPAAIPSPVVETKGVTLPPSFDLGAMITKTRRSFRDAKGGGFTATGMTHEVRVSSAGTEFAPERGETVGKPAAFAVPEMRRGASTVRVAAPSLRDRSSVVAASRDGQVEVLHENREDGIEQSFRFAARPAGEGDLVVTQRVTGESFRGETSSGLHFVDPATGLGVHYGHGTFVDARGERVDVPARFEGGAIVLRVPAKVVDGLAYPAVLDPVINAEFAVDAPITVAAIYEQEHVSVAHAAGGYFAVWSDRRRLFGSAIMGTRVTDAAVVSSPLGIPVSTAQNEQRNPVVATDGTDFLVVWEDERESVNTDLTATRVTAAGVVSDPLGVPVSRAGNRQRFPSVAHTPGGYLVVWQDNRGGTDDVYSTFLGVDGSGITVASPGGVRITGAAGAQTNPTVSAIGSNALVVWTDARAGGGTTDVYGARLTVNAGAIMSLDTDGVLVANPGESDRNPVVANDGTRYVVAWESVASAANVDVLATRVRTTSSLEVLDPTGVVVANSNLNESAPSIAWSSTRGFLVGHTRAVSSTNTDVYVTRLAANDASLVRRDGAGLPVAFSLRDEGASAIGATDTGFLVFWEERFRATSANDVFCMPVNVSTLDDLVLGALATTRVTFAANTERYASVAFGDGVYFVAWVDGRAFADEWRVYGMRLGPDGTPLHADAIRLGDSADDLSEVAVAYANGQFMAVWNTDGDLFGRRVLSATGTPVGIANEPIAIGNFFRTRPSIASDGSQFLVVWSEDRGSNLELAGQRISNLGVFLDPPTGERLTNAAGAQVYPSVAYGSGGYTIVWQDVLTNNASSDIRGGRIDGSAATLAITGGNVPISNGTGVQTKPAIATNGTEFMVVWEDWRDGVQPDLYANRVRVTAGALDPRDGDGVGIVLSSGFQNYAPEVAWNGSHYTSVWTESRDGLYKVYGARIFLDGTTLDPAGFPISDDPTYFQADATIASQGSGRSLVLYDRYDPTLTVQGIRLNGRFLTPEVNQGQPCAGDFECTTNFCVDGFCCNTACGRDDATRCQACSIAAGSTSGMDGTCGVRATGASCRASTGICDPPEQCDGTNGTCPADSLIPDNTTCGPNASCQGGVCRNDEDGGVTPANDGGFDSGIFEAGTNDGSAGTGGTSGDGGQDGSVDGSRDGSLDGTAGTAGTGNDASAATDGSRDGSDDGAARTDGAAGAAGAAGSGGAGGTGDASTTETRILEGGGLRVSCATARIGTRAPATTLASLSALLAILGPRAVAAARPLRPRRAEVPPCRASSRVATSSSGPWRRRVSPPSPRSGRA
ncbi:MAG: hypothetical protein U0169_02600 [Polyangiaceae bacterium]